jgi:glycosyltransferase involved in cell wall biosynthesis
MGYPWFSKKYFGIPWHAIIWRIKLNKLNHRKDLVITAPSNWILERAKRSLILKDMPIYLLPNPIDVDNFCACSYEKKHYLREQCGFKRDDFVFCFGAVGGKKNPFKGSELLEKAFEILIPSLSESVVNKIKIITFGGSAKGADKMCGVDVYQMGHIASPADLAILYSSADCVVVPSLVESFGQVAAEALACETPVISFACSGLLDIVIDGKTGLTAMPYDVEQLSEKLKLIFSMSEGERKDMGKRGREYVINSFSYPVIADKYQKIIDEAKKLKELHS